MSQKYLLRTLERCDVDLEDSLPRALFDDKPKCEPFKRDGNVFSVYIDNIKYPRYIPMRQNSTLNFDCLNQSTRPKLILIWNEFFTEIMTFYDTGGHMPFVKNNCPVQNCALTTNRSRLAESNLVVVNARDSHLSLPNCPKNEKQHWMFSQFESPVYSYDYRQYNNRFDSSATYRTDSTVFGAYFNIANLLWAPNADFRPDTDHYDGKTDFAYILVSACNADSNRLQIIRELQKYVRVDVYGKCGRPCPIRNDTTDCHKILTKTYRFYFAFENSICKDYITEKFFRILNYSIIPVVFGGGKYDQFVPKSGFINVLDYETVERLAGHLKYVAGNRTAYNEYFEWRKFIRYHEASENPWGHVFCELCIMLNLEEHSGSKYEVIEDMSTFWDKKVDCHKATVDESGAIRLRSYSQIPCYYSCYYSWV